MVILQSTISIVEAEMQNSKIIKELSDFLNPQCGREFYL